jgi:hypothetical protein
MEFPQTPSGIQVNVVRESAIELLISFNSVLGTTYLIEHTGTVPTATWSNLQQLAETGGKVRVPVTISGDAQFYRARSQ